MGSENNMVAVPVTDADRALRDQIINLDWPGNHAAYEAELDQIIARARLASPQPDAQQGEAESVAATFEKAEIWAPNAPAPRMSGPGVARLIRALIATATPPSPALDAATIEREAMTEAEALYMLLHNSEDTIIETMRERGFIASLDNPNG